MLAASGQETPAGETVGLTDPSSAAVDGSAPSGLSRSSPDASAPAAGRLTAAAAGRTPGLCRCSAAAACPGSASGKPPPDGLQVWSSFSAPGRPGRTAEAAGQKPRLGRPSASAACPGAGSGAALSPGPGRSSGLPICTTAAALGDPIAGGACAPLGLTSWARTRAGSSVGSCRGALSAKDCRPAGESGGVRAPAERLLTSAGACSGVHAAGDCTSACELGGMRPAEERCLLLSCSSYNKRRACF